MQEAVDLITLDDELILEMLYPLQYILVRIPLDDFFQAMLEEFNLILAKFQLPLPDLMFEM